MNLESYLQLVTEWLVATGMRIVLIVTLGGIALRLSKAIASRMMRLIGKTRTEDVEFSKRLETLSSVVRYSFSAVILGASAMMILGQLGIDIGPILAAAGVVGLAVGFGAQNLVQDVINGFFILLDDEIRVGDIVEAGGKQGLVERVNLRMTVLRDLAGNVHYLRNGNIDVVTNLTKDFSRYVFEIGVAYREDVDEVMGVMRQVDEELRADPAHGENILEPIEILGLDQFTDSAVIIKARTTTKPNQQFRVGREFNRRLKKRFDELNIEIPFPHRTLYMGQDKHGEAPPLPVLVQEHRMSGG